MCQAELSKHDAADFPTKGCLAEALQLENAHCCGQFLSKTLTSDVANGTGVMSGVIWAPDGVSCGLFDPPEWSSMVALVGKLLFCSAVIRWSSSLCFDPTFAKQSTR